MHAAVAQALFLSAAENEGDMDSVTQSSLHLLCNHLRKGLCIDLTDPQEINAEYYPYSSIGLVAMRLANVTLSQAARWVRRFTSLEARSTYIHKYTRIQNVLHAGLLVQHFPLSSLATLALVPDGTSSLLV